MSNWAKRVKSRMQELCMTQEVLANKMGITRGAVTHYLAGRRVPPLKQFQKLANILKVEPAWLQFGVMGDRLSNVKKLVITPEKNAPAHCPLPVLGWEQVAAFIDASRLAKEEVQEFIPHFYTDKHRWYGLRIKGDAMTSTLAGHLSFVEDDLIIVDPDKPAAHGSYVIALLPKAKEVTFKQYVVDGGIHYLKPLNPQYPIIQIDDRTHICGTVASVFRELCRSSR